ncbi:MAG: MBL fold metallo-hydrolase [Pseudomonadota bacterium]
MKVTLLGHASVLVEMDGAVCLMDPVFFDRFEEGAVAPCPSRKVYPDRLPPVDTLIVSHRHPDHFDLRSLALVPRTADAIIPADPLIAYALKKLGFARLHAVHPMGEIRSGSFELLPTRSEARGVREFGMVFKDKSGTFWNQVDTFLSAATIEEVARRRGRIDLLFAMYASQNFEYFESRAAEFPYETHRRNLENVLSIDPRTVAPGAAGFRFCGDHAWLNSFLFPISRQRFVADLDKVGYGGAAVVMDPGDVFDIDAGRVNFRPGASDVAMLVADDTAALRFDPTAPVPELADPDLGYARADLARMVGEFIAVGLYGYARAGYGNGDKVVALYRRQRARYGVAVVFPDEGSVWYRFEFGPERIELATGTAEADMVHWIAASALAAWIERKKSFFYVRAYSRRHQALYEVAGTGREVELKRKALPDLLMHYLLNVAAGSELAAKQQVDLELAALSPPAAAS